MTVRSFWPRFERRLWDAIAPRVARRGLLIPQSEPGLRLVVSTAGTYFRVRHYLATWEQQPEDLQAARPKVELAHDVRECRELLMQMIARWSLSSPRDGGLYVVNATRDARWLEQVFGVGPDEAIEE